MFVSVLMFLSWCYCWCCRCRLWCWVFCHCCCCLSLISCLSSLVLRQGDDALSEDRIELDNQLHVFEAVMNKDIAEVSESST